MGRFKTTEDKRSRIARLLGLEGRKIVSLGDLLDIVEQKLSRPVEITQTMRGMAAVVLNASTVDGFYGAAKLLAKEILGEDEVGVVAEVR